MHMLLVISAGIILPGVFALFGKLWGGDAAGIALAPRYFVPVWLLVALTNMRVGVSKAGYGVSEELPILSMSCPKHNGCSLTADMAD